MTDRFSQIIRRALRKLSDVAKDWVSIRSIMLAMLWTIGVERTLDLIRGLIYRSHKRVIWYN